MKKRISIPISELYKLPFYRMDIHRFFTYDLEICAREMMAQTFGRKFNPDTDLIELTEVHSKIYQSKILRLFYGID
jgi:hypothetical protein